MMGNNMSNHTFSPFNNCSISYSHELIGGIDAISGVLIKTMSSCPEVIHVVGCEIFNEYSDDAGLKMACLEHFNESNNGK